MQTENNESKLTKISFTTTIQAPKQKVWRTLWDDESYKAWTAAFAEGSCAVSDWQEGSKILFLDAKGDGMYSTIAKKTENEFISFKYNGEVKNKVELPLDEKNSDWVNGFENYTLKEDNGITTLDVDITVTDAMLNYFNKTFPTALENVKKIAETKTAITIETSVNAPVEKVWEYWNEPAHITQWCSASPEWHTPRAENDLRVGGKFSSRMEAKDGSMGFDFGGVYDEVKTNERISYTIGDGRKVSITFDSNGDVTKVTETFQAEDENPVEMQRGGWQAILDNFKKYTEAN
ncbi:MAG: SRPBCC domain-containing protein [Ferruginibacter sp.]